MKGARFACLIALIALAPGAWSEAELEQSAEEAAQEATASQSPAGAPEGTIARSTFTTAVVDREPRDSITSLANDHRKVYYFTELRGFEGSTVTHRWEYEGETLAEVPFEIRGPRWRVYSSKTLPADRTGEWTVSVVDEMNRVLRTESFLYEETAASEAPAGAHREGERSEKAAAPQEDAPPAAPED